jgi:uncharacterized protein involved in exopolysaccharide biosynthesis/Mrp family chromosome partitioning ATPase
LSPADLGEKVCPMNEPEQKPESEGGVNLPFDPRALAIGLASRLPWILGGMILVLALALIAALINTERIYRAETVLMYTPAAPEGTPEASGPSLFTLVGMVKLEKNLRVVREKLQIPASLGTLGRAIQVEVERRTSLVMIRVEWDDPQMVAAIANTVREVFLEDRYNTHSEETGRRIGEVEQGLALNNKKLAEADAALRGYTMENKIVDLSKEAQWFLEELTNLSVLHEQAKIEKSTVELQTANIQRVVQELQERIAKEQTEIAAQTDALSETNIRIQRLRESIYDDKQQREREAKLSLKEVDLERARKNYELGVIAKSEYDKAVAEYDAQIALTVDSDEVRQWKEEIEKLDQKVIPAGGTGSSPTGNLLTSILFREFEINLQKVAVDKKIEHLSQALARVNARLEKIPDLEREYVNLQRVVNTLEDEKKTLERELSALRRELQSGGREFSLISVADEPVRPSKSNRKVVFLGFCLMGFAAVGFLTLASVALDLRIKTRRDLEIHSGAPALAAFGPLAQGADILPIADGDPPFVETFRILARRLRNLAPKRGARIMFVSCGHDEGTTFVVASLAAILGRQDENVVVIDGQLRPPRPRESPHGVPARVSPDKIAGFIPQPYRRTYFSARRQGIENRFYDSPDRRELMHLVDDAKPALGLGDILSSNAALDQAIHPTRLKGVHCIPRSPEGHQPDLIGTAAMRTLMDNLSSRYSLVLVDSPPVGGYFDAEALAASVDGIILVGRTDRCYWPLIRSVSARLRATGKPVLGCIATAVEPTYAQGRA